MLRRLEPLWDNSQLSIVEHVRAHLPGDESPGLTEGGASLPDEEELGGSFRWIPGAMDGVGTHHFGVGSEDAAIDELIGAIRAAAPDRRGARARRKVYAAARAGDAIRVVDPLLDRLRAVGMPAEKVQDTARWLVSESRHRDPVKLGVALLGLGHTVADRDVLKVLARHEEFTLFVAVALANTTSDPDRELHALARSVEAWGRVHLSNA